MKFKNITAGVLALAGAAILSTSAQASITYTTGDLFLGFRLSGGTQDYLVNIGSNTQFTNTANFTLSLGSIGADLTSIFGANWNTNSSIYWGIFGTPSDGTTTATLLVSRQRSNVSTAATLFAERSNSNQLSTVSKFQTAITGYLDVGGISTASTNSSVAVIQDASSAKSYNAFTSISSDFSVWNTIEGNFANGTAGSVLDLQQLNTTNSGLSAATLGSFSIDDSGSLSYIGAAAVPEPSTYVMTALGGLGMLAILRRRKTLAAA